MASTERKRKSYRAGAVALLLSVIGIIFIANFASYRTYARIDLTEGNRYTLSESTRKIVSGLPDVVTIQAVYSSNMPTELSMRVREVKDLLSEYENYGGENLKVEFLDPTGDPELQSRLSEQGIQPFVLPMQGLDERVDVKIYASILVKYLDKEPEIIRQALNIESLEYRLTNAVNRMVYAQEVKVGILNPGGKRKLDREFGTLYNALEERFQVEEVDTKDGGPIDEKIETLLVINPRSLNDVDLYAIDQFLMGGGKVMVLTEGVNIFFDRNEMGTVWPVQGWPKRPEGDQLVKLLEHYGVSRKSNIVQEEFCANYPIIPKTDLGVSYPPFPIIDMREGNQADHVINSGLSYLTFAWPSSLKITDTIETVEALELVRTSEDAWTQSGRQLMVNPRQIPKSPLPVPGQETGQKTLAVLLSGEFSSYFADKETPLEGSTAEAANRETIAKSRDSRLLVIGNSYFVSDVVPIDVSHNVDFVSGAVEWLMGGDMLSDIKKRGSATRPFDKDLTGGDVLLISLVLPLSAPLLVVLAGIIRFSVRASRRKSFIESVKS